MYAGVVMFSNAGIFDSHRDPEPFDEVVVVLALVPAPPPDVAFGVVGAARVGIADGVPPGTPEGGVGRFELLQAGQRAHVQSQQGQEIDVLRCVAPALAVGAPRDEHGHLLVAGGAEHVHVDRHAVAERDGDVLVQDDVDRQRHEAGLHLEARRKGPRAGLELREQALPAFRLAMGGNEYGRIVGHGHAFCVVERGRCVRRCRSAVRRRAGCSGRAARRRSSAGRRPTAPRAADPGSRR